MDDVLDPNFTNLVRRAKTEDKDAFPEIYRSTISQVFATVRFLSPSPADVEEIVQEVYVALWKALPRYDETRPFLPWLHGLIVRQARSVRRSRFRLLRLQHAMETQHVKEGMPVGVGAEGERVTLVESLLSLPLAMREVVVLRYLHGYALNEIAQILGIPEGTARSRNHVALKRLRVEFDNEGGNRPCLPNEI